MIGRLLSDPLWPARLGLRALDDLHTLARAVGSPPGWVRTFGRRLDALHAQFETVIPLMAELVDVGRELRGLGDRFEARTAELRREGRQLIEGGRRLAELGDALVGRGDRALATMEGLEQLGERLGGQGRELIEEGRTLRDRGDDLIRREEALSQTAGRIERLTTDLLEHVSSAVRLMPAGIQALERLEQPAETMADTVEPLQSATEGIGRAARRLRRS